MSFNGTTSGSTCLFCCATSLAFTPGPRRSFGLQRSLALYHATDYLLASQMFLTERRTGSAQAACRCKTTHAPCYGIRRSHLHPDMCLTRVSEVPQKYFEVTCRPHMNGLDTISLWNNLLSAQTAPAHHLIFTVMLLIVLLRDLSCGIYSLQIGHTSTLLQSLTSALQILSGRTHGSANNVPGTLFLSRVAMGTPSSISRSLQLLPLNSYQVKLQQHIRSNSATHLTARDGQVRTGTLKSKRQKIVIVQSRK